MITRLLIFGLAMSVLVSAFLWLIGRGKAFKMRNDEIYEGEIHRKY